MALKRRNFKLHFAVTIGGERFPCYLGARSLLFRWNNPTLYRRRSGFQNFHACNGDLASLLIEGAGVRLKREYQGYAGAFRFNRFLCPPGDNTFRRIERRGEFTYLIKRTRL